MSISSFNSESPRQTGKRAPGSKETSSKHGPRNRNGSIAQQLSKNYFLNTKQLLKHLSPMRGQSQNEFQQ